MEGKRAKLVDVNSKELDIYKNVAYQLTLTSGENEQENKENWNTDNDNNNIDNNNNNNFNTVIVEKKSCLLTKLIENEIYTCEIVPMDKNSGKLGVPCAVSFQTTTAQAASPAPRAMLKKQARWSIACCDNIKVTNDDLAIIYCDDNQTTMHHKMYFGDKMDLSNNNGIFEIQIEILDMGHGSHGFVFGICTQDNKYFECAEGRYGGFCCNKGKGCGVCSTSGAFWGAQGGLKSKCSKLHLGDKITCRLDLNNDNLQFKLNHDNFVKAQFKGFTKINKQNGFYFAYTSALDKSHIRVLRYEKVN